MECLLFLLLFTILLTEEEDAADPEVRDPELDPPELVEREEEEDLPAKLLERCGGSLDETKLEIGTKLTALF